MLLHKFSQHSSPWSRLSGDAWNSLPPTRALLLSDARSRSSVGGLPYSLAVAAASPYSLAPRSCSLRSLACHARMAMHGCSQDKGTPAGRGPVVSPAGVRALAGRGSSSPYSLVFSLLLASLACVPPLGAACRSCSLLSLPSSAVGSAAAVHAFSMCTEPGRLWRTVWHVARWRVFTHFASHCDVILPWGEKAQC